MAPKSKRIHPVSFVTLSLWLGVFFVCGSWQRALAETNCPTNQTLQWVELAQVVDGDTLRLEDGRKLRVLGINTPELGSKDRDTDPLAKQARQQAQRFFVDQRRIGLLVGKQRKDRYGRVLAEVYRTDGQNLSAYLLAQGLAMQVVIPPNTNNWRCLERIQRQARTQQKGVWQHPYFKARRANQLTSVDTGFQRVVGTVEKISETRNGLWLEMGKLVIRIAIKNQHYFENTDLDGWVGERFEVRGWVIDRSGSPLVKQYRYKPFLINIGHPAMITKLSP